MIYSEKALQRIIIENIENKHIFGIASKLYYDGKWLEENDKKELTTELTGLLLNKQYEQPVTRKPVPRKPVTETIKLF